MTTTKDDYIDPTVDGTLSWCYASSCTFDSNQDMENWQNRMHEVSRRRCAQLTKSLRQIGSEVSQIATFSGFYQVKEFLVEYEIQVPSFQRLKALDVALRATPAIWWATHKQNIATWETCQRLLMIRFGERPDELECSERGV